VDEPGRLPRIGERKTEKPVSAKQGAVPPVTETNKKPLARGGGSKKNQGPIKERKGEWESVEQEGRRGG